MNLQRARDWADLGVKVLTAAAIIAGGIWAYYQFRVTRTDVESVQVTVTGEVIPYSTDARLLLIHVRPRNTGKILAQQPESFAVIVRGFPGDVKGGVVDIEKQPQVVPPIDLLKRFPDGYELEPGVEYDEIVAMIVPKGLYSARAEFGFGDKKTEVDHTAVIRVD